MNKMIISILLIVGLVGMIGTAAAMPATVNINKDPFNIAGGNIDESTVDITHINYYKSSSYTRIVTVTAEHSNLYIRVCDVSGDSTCSGSTNDTGWSNEQDPNKATHNFTYTATADNDYTYSVYVKGSVDGEVTVYDNEGTEYFEEGTGHDTASCTRYAMIPEFPTIALPVAAILGLMFIFSSRKKKE